MFSNSIRLTFIMDDETGNTLTTLDKTLRPLAF